MSNSITQALVWKCWRLSFKPLLLTQSIVICLSAISIIFFPGPSAEETPDIIANALVFLGLLILFGMMNSNSVKESMQRFSVGFPFVQEFVMPISTLRLVIIPVLFYCAALVFAYVFPLWVLHFTLGIAGPQFLVVGLLVQAVVIYMSIAWFSKSGLSQLAAWLVLFVLYYTGFVVPELEIQNNSVRIISWELTSFLVSSLIAAMFLTALYLGAAKQRFNEDLLGVKPDLRLIDLSSAGRQSAFGNDKPCPTDSPVRAQYWREAKLRGVNYSLTTGSTIGLLTLILVRSIVLIADPQEPWDMEKMSTITMGMYFMYFALIHAQSYSIRYKNGVGNISLFDKLVPMGTAQLNFIQMKTLLMSCLVGALAMLFIIAVLGGFFISEFSVIRSVAFDNVLEFLETPILSLVLGIIIFVANFTVASFLFSTLNAWSLINPSLIFKFSIGLSAYTFSVACAIYFFTEASQFDAVMRRVFLWHLWVPILGAPLAIVLVYRYCVEENVLSVNQVAKLSLIAGAVWVVFLFDLFQTDYFSQEQFLEYMIVRTIWGAAPFLGVGLSLLTLSKIRHGT